MKRSLNVSFILWILLLSFFICASAAEENGQYSITVEYSGALRDNRSITVNYTDEWLLHPDDEYNHQLMQASFAMAAAGFRDKTKLLADKDVNILNFFDQSGYTAVQTYDFNVIPTINTIGTAIAHKKAGDAVLIAVSLSGNNYQGEWAGNLNIDDENRVKGFNDAADLVMQRIIGYIKDNQLSGNLRIWVSGYSRAAAVSNIFAADAVDSGMFQAVYAYTFGTPRTTRTDDTDQYPNIFNLINPFDLVPMVPFPEWGFKRYGIDLFIPSVETDSQWFNKASELADFLDTETENKMDFNPQMNITVHTILDYLAFFISSANSYKSTFQIPLINFIETKDYKSLFKMLYERISIKGIRDRLIKRDEIIRYQMHEFYNFMDYLSQLIYSSLLAQKFSRGKSFIWDPDISFQENLAFNHYDKTYRSWLFSDQSPENLLSRDAKYAHITIKGDVDVDVFDMNGDFVIHLDNTEGFLSLEEESISMPDFQGESSDTVIYGERRGDQSLIVIPLDQVYTVGIHSHKNQTIRLSYAEYSAKKLHAEIRYIYFDEYDEGEYFLEEFDPAKERNYTKEELQEMGVLVTEPWSKNVVYSPTAVMRLENSGVFHPSPLFLIIFIALVLILIIIIFIRILILICKLIWKIMRKSKTKPGTENSAVSDMNDPVQEITPE